MIEVISAIALLCQVTGTVGDPFATTNYKEAKSAQVNCQQKLLKCVQAENEKTPKGQMSFGLENCVNKGGY